MDDRAFKRVTDSGYLLNMQRIEQNVSELKASSESKDGLVEILGNLEQKVFGGPAYSKIESKAAHLFYFVVKI